MPRERSRIAGVSRSIIERPSVYSRSVPVKVRPGVRSNYYVPLRTTERSSSGSGNTK